MGRPDRTIQRIVMVRSIGKCDWSGMTLEQLRIFVAVADRLHMTRAADALHITQSAASAAIASLEARHATRLFDRVGRGLALSGAGRAFLPEARAVLARAEAAERALDELAGLARGTLVVAASQTVASYWLPPRLARFALAHPGLTLRLEVGNSETVADAVQEGAADLGLVEGDVDRPKLRRRVVGCDRLVLVAAPAHPLAGGVVTPGVLGGAAWAMREPGSGTRSAFERTMAARGLDPDGFRIVLTLPSNEAVLAAVEDGSLLAAVSALAARPGLESGRLRELPYPLDRRAFLLLTHAERQRSRAAAAFVAALPAAVEA